MKRRVMEGREKIKFPEDGLLHYWGVNGNAVDSKGGANGTASGVSYLTGVNGNAAYFSSGSYIRIPTNINLSSWSLSLWYNVTRINDYLGLICYRNGSVSFYGFAIVDIQITLYYGSQQINFSHRSSMNTWYHVVFCCDGSGINWYLNGTYKGRERSFSLYLPNSSYIGHDPLSGYDRSFKGRIDEMAIWNRSLSQEEVQLLYNQGKGLFYK